MGKKECFGGGWVGNEGVGVGRGGGSERGRERGGREREREGVGRLSGIGFIYGG